MSGRQFLALLVLVAVALAGVHFYDAHASQRQADTVYETQLKFCRDGNPSRAQARRFYAATAHARAHSAQFADAGNPAARYSDHYLAVIAHQSAKTYAERPGARANGSLRCSLVTRHP